MPLFAAQATHNSSFQFGSTPTTSAAEGRQSPKSLKGEANLLTTPTSKSGALGSDDYDF